ncbi:MULTISPECIES: hypothetical protein [Citrobacter freundii complex]|uniref:hypothetical protein n=1 Tax=Citrobacter freundii complex TaxID=1344959 RepID=UPI000651D87E|nr:MULTISPECIES: hypothetical protein [Citrobacter freundii complex]EGS5520865.1 hypothetical protein [Citrobacter freundii]MCY3417846.1 hypothetical protein [Citrobacter freundii]
MNAKLRQQLDSLDIAIHEALVLRVIAHYAVNGVAKTGIRAISQTLGLKPDFVKDVLSDLRDRRLISITKAGIKLTLPDPVAEPVNKSDIQEPGQDYIKAVGKLREWYGLKKSVKEEGPKRGSVEWARNMASLAKQHRERRKQAA